MLQINNNETLQNLPRTLKLYTKNKKLEDFIVNNVIRYCEKCGTRLAKGDVVQVNEEGQMRVFVIKCHNCGHQQALVVSLVDNSIAKTNLALDIPVHSIRRYANMGPITAKDVVHIHNVLKRIKTVKDFIESSI